MALNNKWKKSTFVLLFSQSTQLLFHEDVGDDYCEYFSSKGVMFIFVSPCKYCVIFFDRKSGLCFIINIVHKIVCSVCLSSMLYNIMSI